MAVRILVAGNPLVARDALPISILPELRRKLPEIEFEELDVEDLESEGKRILVIDTIDGIKKPCVVRGTAPLLTKKIYSLHDFDLGMRLKLLKKMGLLERVVIFGVPPNYPKKRALNELASLIRATLPSGSARRTTCTGRRRG
ncbi:MAG: hypothetical protein QXH27_03925 [Candidatus Micrarchaeia archaeon]